MRHFWEANCCLKQPLQETVGRILKSVPSFYRRLQGAARPKRQNCFHFQIFSFATQFGSYLTSSIDCFHFTSTRRGRSKPLWVSSLNKPVTNHLKCNKFLSQVNIQKQKKEQQKWVKWQNLLFCRNSFLTFSLYLVLLQLFHVFHHLILLTMTIYQLVEL